MWTSSRTSGRASSPCSPLTRSECASQQYNNIFDFFSYKSTKEPIYQDHPVHTTATATTTSLSLVTSSRRGRHALYLPSQQVARDSNGKGSDDVAYQSGHRHQREGRDVGVRPGVPEHGSHQKLRRRRRARSEARTTARRRRRRLTWHEIESSAPAQVPRKKDEGLAPAIPEHRHSGPLNPMKKRWTNPIFDPNLSTSRLALTPFLLVPQLGKNRRSRPLFAATPM